MLKTKFMEMAICSAAIALLSACSNGMSSSDNISKHETENNVPVVMNSLKSDGKDIKDSKGRLINLRGVNAGGYLFQEFWMTPTSVSSNVTCEYDIYTVLDKRFGKEKMYELLDAYQASYWTEADFENCRELGFNCIRLPFWYRNLVDEDGRFYKNPYEKMDWFVNTAAEYGLYVIIDFHGAPGSQNGSDHSGIDGKDNKKDKSEFFFGPEAQKKSGTLLYNMGRHCKTLQGQSKRCRI